MSISREMGYVAVEMFGLKLELRRSAERNAMNRKV